METVAAGDEQARRYGPFIASLGGVLEFRGSLANVRISAPVAVIVGDGSAVNVTAPVEIDVELLEIDAREVSIFKSAGSVADELQQVTLNAVEAVIGRVVKVVVLGGRLSVSFPGASHGLTTPSCLRLPPARRSRSFAGACGGC
jgi:hypothetical protein